MALKLCGRLVRGELRIPLVVEVVDRGSAKAIADRVFLDVEAEAFDELPLLIRQSFKDGRYSPSTGMVYRCEGDLRPDLMAEILEHGTIEIPGIVNGDLLWNSIALDDVLPEEFLDGGGGYVGNRFCLNPFGEVLYSTTA
jgi:hypothetical protein